MVLVNILFGTVYYGLGYVSNGFMVLDIDYDQYNVNVDGCTTHTKLEQSQPSHDYSFFNLELYSSSIS